MKKLVTAAIGECVHVAGVANFGRLAEQAGWEVIFLGPATPIQEVIEVAKRENADMVGISYRLTPDNGERLVAEFAEEADELRRRGVHFAFGGTPPVVNKIKQIGFFEACFDGTEATEDIVAYLKGEDIVNRQEQDYPQTTVERISWKSPYPLLRHHFGLPDMEATLEGIKKIAESRIIDVISLGIDQEAQENFFHSERQDQRRYGAGGVPVRTADDYRALYAATRRGNFPLLRTYSGTDDFISLAEMYVETIHIAWAAVPFFWFNQMDGRGPWDLEGSIREHQNLMAWYGLHNIPVEANEAHHWGMRDAHDVVFVVSAYLAAYNAKAFGVKDHIVQMMLNSPPTLSTAMDIAKMLAIIELTSRLESPDFRIWKQTRTGLLSYPVDIDRARAHLATSVYEQMALEPNIVHVVGYPEADHAVNAEEVIESCKMAQNAIQSAVRSQVNLTQSALIQMRIKELMGEAGVLIEAIRRGGMQDDSDPLTNPEVLANAVKTGLLDAPQLMNNLYGRGEISTMADVRGACIAVDKKTGQPINETNRILLISERSTM